MATGTGNLPYPGRSYTPFDILTAEELNEDVANIESLADGTGIGDGAVTASTLAQSAITLGYKESVTPQASITSEVDVTGLSVTVTVPAGGRRLKITGHSTINNNTANGSSSLYIYEGATKLGVGQANNTGAGYGITVTALASLTPTAGTHTYKLRAQGVVGTVQISAGPNTPTFILAELI